MNRKTAEQMAFRLIAYYNFNGEMSDGSIHPKIKDLIEYSVKFVEQENAKLFYDKIIANCKWMPNHQELSEIYNTLNRVNNYRIENNITKKDALISFTDVNTDIRYYTNENYTVADVIEDDENKMSTREQLKKYGIKLCSEAWIKITETWTEDKWKSWEIKNKRDAGFNKNITIDMKGMEYIHE